MVLRDPIFRRFLAIVVLVIFCAVIALPKEVVIPLKFLGPNRELKLVRPEMHLSLGTIRIDKVFDLKQGLDIRGGTQVVLQADMSNIDPADRETALSASREVILRRVDLFGVSEPVVQTSRNGDDYRLIVELAGVDDPAQALQLIGTTAQLDFRLEGQPTPEATQSAAAFLDSFSPTDLTGKDLKRSSVQFDQNTGEPVISLEFNSEGVSKFSKLTQEHVGEVIGIFLDDYPLMLPRVDVPILDGRAIITGQFTVEDAKNLSIQLNAGALPVPIQVLEQRTVGASLGQEAVSQSVRAGLVGLGLVMIFMVLLYGWKGVIANMALLVYALITISVYKVLNITLTLPGIAGLLLSIGMAVDSNILIFERMKEELRAGKSFDLAMRLGFGRAWDSIKDANLTTIFAALVLINPMDFSFLNSSGLVRGFGMTLLIGVLISLFTGVVVTRTFMRLFLREYTVK